MANLPWLDKLNNKTHIEYKKGLWKVKQYIILINVDKNERLAYIYLKGIESDIQPKINWEKQLT